VKINSAISAQPVITGPRYHQQQRVDDNEPDDGLLVPVRGFAEEVTPKGI
jgi:hypothetical protein